MKLHKVQLHSKSMQKKAEREAQWAAAAAAAQTGRSDGSSEGSQDQATYELAATSYTGGPLPDASSCNILKESSTFIHEPTQVVPDQPQPPAQVRIALLKEVSTMRYPLPRHAC